MRMQAVSRRGLLASVSGALAMPALAQEAYPARSVRIIVTFAAGKAELGRLEVPEGKGWRTAAGTVTLPAGTSTVRLRISGAGARLDSLRWSAP